MIIIPKWFGRLGNNVLQLVNSIHYALLHRHDRIQIPSHPLLNTTQIKIPVEEGTPCSDIIRNEFFYLSQLRIPLPSARTRKKYFQTYIKPIFRLDWERQPAPDPKTLFIHIRGGDVFSPRPHTGYVQPPLVYYKRIIAEGSFDRVVVVSEDKRNPCVNALLELPNTIFQSGSLAEDLLFLSSAVYLAVGHGSFGILAYFLASDKTQMYVPEYACSPAPLAKEHMFIISDTSAQEEYICMIPLPNYIRIGEWNNTPEQRRFMLEYVDC